MLTKNILSQNFKIKTLKVKLKNNFILKLKNEIRNKNNLLFSFTCKYKYSYKKKLVRTLKKNFSNINLVGMGGSILGSKAIYFFLKDKIKKKINFLDNLVDYRNNLKHNRKPS